MCPRCKIADTPQTGPASRSSASKPTASGSSPPPSKRGWSRRPAVLAFRSLHWPCVTRSMQTNCDAGCGWSTWRNLLIRPQSCRSLWRRTLAGLSQMLRAHLRQPVRQSRSKLLVPSCACTMAPTRCNSARCCRRCARDRAAGEHSGVDRGRSHRHEEGIRRTGSSQQWPIRLTRSTPIWPSGSDATAGTRMRSTPPRRTPGWSTSSSERQQGAGATLTRLTSGPTPQETPRLRGTETHFPTVP
jgi:hypothetical protein